MPASEDKDNELIPSNAVAGMADAVSELRHTLLRFADAIDGKPSWSGESVERAWSEVRRQHKRVAARFTELAETLEAAADVADAQAALDEPGASDPWEDVKAELGLS
jgi:hypothetical protein